MVGISLLGGVLIVVGTLLPWLQVGALLVNRGIDNPDGAIVIGIGIAACAVSIFRLLLNTSVASEWPILWKLDSTRRVLGVLLLILAAVAFWTGFVDLQDVQSRIGEASNTILGNAVSYTHLTLPTN